MSFNVDKDSNDRVKAKYKEITLNVFAFNFATLQIQIQRTIIEEFLKVSEKEGQNFFERLFVHFLKCAMTMRYHANS